MLSRAMGGPEAIDRQHALGKLSARERIDTLLDPDSFREMGRLTGKGVYDNNEDAMTDFTPANSVIGTGRVEG